MNPVDDKRLDELILWLDRKYARHHEEEDHEAARALSELKRLRQLEAAAGEAVAMREPWPLHDSITKLIEATDHLLTAHGCDKHGHEEYRAALEQTKVLEPKIRALAALVARDTGER